MNTPFSTSKNKRQRTSSSESNNSFVKNVTSRVSGFLPATITKWFSNDSPNANGSAAKAEATDSSTEDEAPESEVPAKRMRFTSPNICNNFDSHDINGSSSTEMDISSGRDMLRRETNFASTSNNINDTETFDKKDKDIDKSTFKSQHTVLAIGKSLAKKRKSLFDTTTKHKVSTLVSANSSCGMQSDLKQPYFKPLLLGSPFYSGRTMYGGAGACYMNTPNIKRKKFAVVTNQEKTNDTSVMSKTTRRIMDLLEHYSSPLTEARRIPQYTKSSLHENTNNSTASSSMGKSAKYQELYVPKIAEVLRLKHKSRLMSTTNAARQLLATHSSSDSILYPTANKQQRFDTDSKPSDKLITEVKRKLTRTRFSGATDIEETVTPIELPSEPLKIDDNKLPTFSLENFQFSMPVTSTSMHPSALQTWVGTKPTLTSVTIPLTKEGIAPTKADSEIFTFSSSVRIPSETTECSSTRAKFTFRSPERQVDKKEGKRSEALLEDKVKSTENIKSDWECPDCWVKNKCDVDKCVCCGGKPPNNAEKKPPKCIQCKYVDAQANNKKCINCLTGPGSISNTNSFSQLPKNQWKCEECWVSNDSGAEKCICCGVSKSKKASPTIQKSIESIEKDWKCDDCWVSNKSILEKCIACGGAKPGGPTPSLKATVPLPESKNSSDFKNNVKTQKSDTWECPICLVSNKSNLSMCGCCDAERELYKGPKVKFNFGMNTKNIFKFGIALKTQEANLAKNTEVNPAPERKPKLDNIEANNNILNETPSFMFTPPTKKSEEKEESTSKKAEEPKMNFKFGISRQTNANQESSEVTKGGKFTELPKSVETDEKPQEVPSVNLLHQKTSSNSLIESTSVTPLSSTTLGSNTNKKETSSNLPSLQPATAASTETSLPQHNFTFSVGAKPSTNFFAAATSTPAATTISFTSPIQSNSASVTAPTLLFQKPESINTTTSTSTIFTKSEPAATATVSLFSNSRDVKPPVPVTTVAMSSNFSFGPNTNNNASSEKSRFVFTFVNNKSGSQSTFKPVFGSINDSGANKFGISAGNTLAPNTAQTTNTLVGSNSLTPVNTLTGGQNIRPGGGTGLSTNTTRDANAFGSGTTLGGNGFGSNTIPRGNGVNAGLTLGGTGLNAGNSIGGNALNVGSTLGSNVLNSANTLLGSGLATDNAPGGGGLTSGGNTMPGAGALGGNALSTGSAHGSNNNIFANPAPSPAFNIQSATTATPIFGQTVQKENMWSANNTATPNLIMSNTNLEKSATFTFGSTTPFSATNSSSTFGNSTQTTQNVFGMNQNQSTQNAGTMFSLPVQNQPVSNIFGSSSGANNPTLAPNIFGTPNVGATPTFGTTNSSIPSFEAPSLKPAPALAFNFGAPPSTGVFGFGQQQQQPGQPTGVYNFGAAGSAPQVQFNMGSAPFTAGRRLRKAVRRTSQR